MSSSPGFCETKVSCPEPQSGIFQCGFQCGFSVGFSVGSSVDCFSVTIWYTDRWHNQCGIILFFVFLEVRNEFPSRRNHIFHLAIPYLSQCKTLSFTGRNLIFHRAKPYLLQGETISFARWNLIFCKAKPYLLQGEKWYIVSVGIKIYNMEKIVGPKPVFCIFSIAYFTSLILVNNKICVCVGYIIFLVI